MKNSFSAHRFLSRHWLHLILIAIVLTRFPFLWNGYGSDPDAWRVAHVGQTLWTTGNYQISRPPGYPLHEIVSAPLVAWGGSFLSNFATIVATLFLITISSQWARTFARHPRLLTFLLAFMPLIWLNSATTMDYIWSLLFIVLAFKDVQENNIVRAGVWMGVAAGFRLSNIIATVPLCVMIYLLHRSKKLSMSFLVATLATTIVAFTPVLIHLGLLGWLSEIRMQTSTIHLTHSDRVLYFGYRTLYSIGPLAALATLWIVAINRNLVRQLLRERDASTFGYLVAVVVFLAQFFWLPLDRSYALPAVFFLLLFIARISTEKQFIAFMVCALSFAFINIDITQHEGARRGKLELHAAPGIVVEEMLRREKQSHDRMAIATVDINGKAMIMTGTSESFWLENPLVEPDTSEVWRTFNDVIARKRTNHNILFTPALNKAELDLVRSRGYTVYCIEKMKGYLESFVGYTMENARVPVIQP